MRFSGPFSLSPGFNIAAQRCIDNVAWSSFPATVVVLAGVALTQSLRTGGYGAGIDYRIWPGTTLGVALAGGVTNWGLASGLGGGNSDAFQAGLYGITRNGPAYLAGALAFAEHWMTTDRFAYAGDHLTARFNAQSYGGRIEGGWRFATFLGGIDGRVVAKKRSGDR